MKELIGNMVTNSGGVLRGVYGPGQQLVGWALVILLPGGLLLLINRKRK